MSITLVSFTCQGCGNAVAGARLSDPFAVSVYGLPGFHHYKFCPCCLKAFAGSIDAFLAQRKGVKAAKRSWFIWGGK